MSKLQVIVGSTRPGRAADHVIPWVVARAEAHAAFEVELLDLRDWPLPLFQEHLGTLGDFVDPPTPTRSSSAGTARSPRPTRTS